MSPRLWGTEFPIPSAPTNLAAEWSDETSYVLLTFDAWPGDPDVYDHLEVRRQIAGGDLIRIDDGSLTDPAITTFTDPEAPTGVALTYDVRFDTGAYESAPTTVITLIEVLPPYLVAPGVEPLSWQVRSMLPGGSRDPQVSKTARWPLGRSTALVTSGPVRKPSGSCSFAIDWADLDQLQRFRDLTAYLATNPYAVWKPVAGESLRVQATFAETGPNVEGYTVSMTWWVVA